MKSITIRRPDDWHLHLRDGPMLATVLPSTSAHFARALIMPNLDPPVVTTANAAAYRHRILAALPPGHTFEPLMTLYLTEATSADDIETGFRDGLITAVKLYPAGATTNSQAGVGNVRAIMPTLERMARHGVPLCIHGEVTDSDIDIFDREAVFIEQVLEPLRRDLPELRMVLEHVSTSHGVDFVKMQDSNVAATLTVHHLMLNRNAILADGIQPHYYCKPVAKRESHRMALRRAATSGDSRFFLGTDSAPHTDALKECACGCAGIFTAPCAIACLAEMFEADGALQKLDAFVASNGARYYGMPLNTSSIRLTRSDAPIAIPDSLHCRGDRVTIFKPTTPIHWIVDGATGEGGTELVASNALQQSGRSDVL